jgi:hypothetical protein
MDFTTRVDAALPLLISLLGTVLIRGTDHRATELDFTTRVDAALPLLTSLLGTVLIRGEDHRSVLSTEID